MYLFTLLPLNLPRHSFTLLPGKYKSFTLLPGKYKSFTLLPEKTKSFTLSLESIKALHCCLESIKYKALKSKRLGTWGNQLLHHHHESYNTMFFNSRGVGIDVI